jgi:hypothetical protein
MYKLRLYLLIFIVILSTSCKSDKQSISQENNQKTDLSDFSKQTETYKIYFVSVNNLRVREDKTKSSKVIHKLKEGAIVYSNGEVSEFTEKVTLRDKEFNTPYYKITFDGNSGWVYGGGIHKIYDKGEKDSFTETLQSFITQIGNKDKTLLDRGNYILKILQQEKSGSAEWNDIMYHMAEYHLKTLASDEGFYSILENREWSPEEYKSAAYQQYDMLSNEFANNFSSAGMKFTASEGMVSLIIDPNKIKKTIGGPFSESMNEYIKIKIIDSNTRFFSDGGISSSLNEIVDFTILVEKFLQVYPSFPRAEDLRNEIEYHHSVIIHGSVNSPAYDFISKELNPEWPIAWDRYLKNNENGLIRSRILFEINKA